MEQLTATRTELVMRRARLALAAQGRSLLKEKRDQLMKEFRKVADVVLAGDEALDEVAAEGRRMLALAEGADGAEAVRSAALAASGDIPLRAKATTVMGVRVADITYEPLGRPRHERGYSLSGTTARVDAVAERFEAQLEMVLDVATQELRLRRLADEIGKTTQRVNALEFVVIPRLEREVAYIQSVLAERERQEHFRLKRVKARKGFGRSEVA